MNHLPASINRVLMVFALLLLLSTTGAAQQLVGNLNTFNASYPSEKIHVHFDKPVYNEGEQIWFKAYVQAQGFPSSISTNLYTELLDRKGKLLMQQVLPVYEGTAAGSFSLPANAREDGDIIFRAYTRWMLNFDTAFLFVKNITIAGRQPLPAQKNTAPAVQLRFFPEGGHLLANQESVLAFKATDEAGNPVSVTGTITNSLGKTVADLRTRHDGMGKLLLAPVAGLSYTAQWRTADGSLHTTPIPEPLTTGLSLVAKPSEGYTSYIIKRSENGGADLRKVHVVAQMNQQLVYRATISLEQTAIISGAIRHEKLTTGILQLTLFDAGWNAVAERIVFVNKNDHSFPVQLNVKTKNLSKRGYNSLEIEVPDTLQSNLSISITDAPMTESEGEPNILTNLLFSGDLRGHIHQPAYYFSSNADSVKEALDLVMLTHGWRRYNWKDIAAGNFPTLKFPRDNFLNVEGTVLGAPRSDLSASPLINVILQTKDSAKKVMSAKIDKDGKFAMDGLIFFDTAQLFYQFNKNERLGRIASVHFKTENLQQRLIGLDTALMARLAARREVSDRSRYFAARRAAIIPEMDRQVKTLEGVVVRAKAKSREEELEKKYPSGLFQTGNARNFNLMDDPTAIAQLNIFDYLEGRVPGLLIDNSAGEYMISRRGSRTALFLDEMPIDPGGIANISMSDIAYVKVIDPPFIGAAGNGAGGAISIYTRRGGDNGRNSTKGLDRGQVPGYTRMKEFYSPDYAKPSPLDAFEDIRSTLYWNPYLLTSRNKRTVLVTFYNNDNSRALRVVLEGMNELGKLARLEQVIQ